MCSDDVVCEVAAVEAVCEGLLNEAEEEESNMPLRKRRGLKEDRELFWPGGDHSDWRYWYRDSRGENSRVKRLAHKFDVNMLTEDSHNEIIRVKRQFGLLQPMFMSSNHFSSGNNGNTGNAEQSDKGEYLGVLIDLITRSLGKDMSFNRFANFLTDLKGQNGHFSSNDFMSAFSREFGEGKAKELRELATQKFSRVNIFSRNISFVATSTESTVSALSPEDVEIIKQILQESSNFSPNSSSGFLSNIDVPQNDQANIAIAEHALKLQNLQNVVQSGSRTGLKVKFQVQGIALD